eukprot:7091770-Pyramimonas_sp.AAC.2
MTIGGHAGTSKGLQGQGGRRLAPDQGSAWQEEPNVLYGMSTSFGGNSRGPPMPSCRLVRIGASQH